MNQELFNKVRALHGTRYKSAKIKIDAKLYSLVPRMKKRCLETNTEFSVTTEELTALFTQQYGEPCRYCGKPMKFSIMQCDHIDPVSGGHPTVITNLQWICKTCNTMKGMLSHESFVQLLALISTFNEKEQGYMRYKLQKGGHYG